MVFFRLLIISFILASCATKEKTTVNESVPIDLNQVTIKIEEGSVENDAYGPSFKNLAPARKSFANVREPILGVYLAPAGALSFAFLEVLKKIDQEKMKIHVIAASGFSALMAAIYAKYQSSNRAQWKLFQLQQNLRKIKVWQSREWYRLLNRFIDDEFKNDRLEKMSTLVLIPTIMNGETKIYSEGNVADILKLNLILNSKTGSFLMSENHRAKEIFSVVGVDIYQSISVLPSNLRLISENDYLLSLFTKLSSELSEEKNSFNIEIDEPMDKIIEYGRLKFLISNRLSELVDHLKIRMEKWSVH